MTLFQSIVIAIVEGLTEFLPVSSTGHMIIAERLLHVTETDFVKVFTVAIQLGAILAVVVLYWKKFFDFSKWQFYVKLIIGVIPALILGFLFSKKIDALLDSATTVAVALLVGGIILLFVDKLFTRPRIHTEAEIKPVNAFIIGIWQCLAMIPGVSRSAASIIGGMQQKLTRSEAAEFSFFLAVPTMFAATAKKIFDFYKDGHTINSQELNLLLIGNVIGFVVALIAIKSFIGYLTKHGFRAFGIYRVIVGTIIIVLILSGHSLKVI